VVRLSAYTPLKSQPVEFVVASSSGATVSVKIPPLKPIKMFSPALNNSSLTEKISGDIVVVKDNSVGNSSTKVFSTR